VNRIHAFLAEDQAACKAKYCLTLSQKNDPFTFLHWAKSEVGITVNEVKFLDFFIFTHVFWRKILET
jgi:hypothetical protein